MFKLNKFFNKNTNENYNYNVRFAGIFKRFIAVTIDIIILSIIIYILWSVTIGAEIRKAFKSYVTNQVNIKIDKNFNDKENEIVKISENLNLIATEGQTISVKNKQKILTNKEKEEVIRDVLIKNKDGVKVFSTLSMFIYLFYNTIFLILKKQATIGQQIFGLKVIKRNGKKLDFFAILNRVLLFSISTSPIVVPFSVIMPYMISKENATLYDFVSGTRVVEITKEIQK